MSPDHEALLKALLEFNILLDRMARARLFAHAMRYAMFARALFVRKAYDAQWTDRRGDEMDMVLSSAKAPGGWER